jgi:hypothetical protein
MTRRPTTKAARHNGTASTIVGNNSSFPSLLIKLGLKMTCIIWKNLRYCRNIRKYKKTVYTGEAGKGLLQDATIPRGL